LSNADILVLRTQVDSQFIAVQKQFETLSSELRAQAIALDLRYQQRYESQKEALDAAFKSQQVSVAAALAAQKEAVQVALVTVEKATNKSDSSLATLLPRLEAESRFADLSQQIERRFNDLASSIKNTLEASDKSLAIANEATEKRFITIAESLKLIGQLSDRLAKTDESVHGLAGSVDEKILTVKTLIDSQGDKIAIAAKASEKAIEVAQLANERRFEVNTGLTAAMAEQSKTFLTRVEFQAVTSSLADKIDALASSMTDKISDLRQSRDVTIGRSAAEPTTASQIAALSNEVAALRDFRATTTGTSKGINDFFGWIVGGVGLLIGIVVFILNVTGH
jgi:hypothetical protein